MNSKNIGALFIGLTIQLLFVTTRVSAQGHSNTPDPLETGKFPCPTLVAHNAISAMEYGGLWWQSIKGNNTPYNQCVSTSRPLTQNKYSDEFAVNATTYYDKKSAEFMKRAGTGFKTLTEVVQGFENDEAMAFYPKKDFEDWRYSPYIFADQSCFETFGKNGAIKNLRPKPGVKDWKPNPTSAATYEVSFFDDKEKTPFTYERLQKEIIADTYRYRAKLEAGCQLNVEIRARQGRLAKVPDLEKNLGCSQIGPTLSKCKQRCEAIMNECRADSDTGLNDEIEKSIKGLEARLEIASQIAALKKPYFKFKDGRVPKTIALPMPEDVKAKLAELNDRALIIEKALPVDSNVKAWFADTVKYDFNNPKNREFIGKKIQESAKKAYDQTTQQSKDISWATSKLMDDHFSPKTGGYESDRKRFSEIMASLPPAPPLKMETTKSLNASGDEFFETETVVSNRENTLKDELNRMMEIGECRDNKILERNTSNEIAASVTYGLAEGIVLGVATGFAATSYRAARLAQLASRASTIGKGLERSSLIGRYLVTGQGRNMAVMLGTALYDLGQTGTGIIDGCIKEGALFKKANLAEIAAATSEQKNAAEQMGSRKKANACSGPVVPADQLALSGCLIAAGLGSLSALPANIPAAKLFMDLKKGEAGIARMAKEGLNNTQREAIRVAAIAGPKDARRAHRALHSSGLSRDQIDDLAREGLIPATPKIKLIKKGFSEEQVVELLKKLDSTASEITDGKGALDDATFEILEKMVSAKIITPQTATNDEVVKVLKNYRRVFPNIKEGTAELDPEKAFALIKKFHESDPKGLENMNKFMDEVASQLPSGASLDQSKAAMRTVLGKYVDEATGKPLSSVEIEKLMACTLSCLK